MITLIVPIDFTGIGDNAAVYATYVAEQLQTQARIILFNVYEKTPAGIDGTPLVNDPKARHEVRILALEKLKNSLLSISPKLSITCLAEASDSLLINIEELIKRENATMVVMGVTNESLAEQLLLGTSAVSIINIGNIPVLIVPSKASYKGIHNIVLAVDFKDTHHTFPLDRIKRLLDLFRPNVHIVSVTDNELQPAIKERKDQLLKSLEGYETNVRFLNEASFVNAINEFSTEKNIDLILVIPHKHSFLSSIFITHNTEKLIHHTSVPVLAVHD